MPIVENLREVISVNFFDVKSILYGPLATLMKFSDRLRYRSVFFFFGGGEGVGISVLIQDASG